MIRDIPTKEDFDVVGSALLDQAWETATSLLLDLDEAYAEAGWGRTATTS
jgi:hypothetical protein